MEYPLWLEIVLAISLSFALMGLGAWMLFTMATKAMNAAARLEAKRTNKETEALDNWKQAYDAEHTEHLNDVADLTNEVLALKREIELKNLILSKVKVADL